MTSLKRAASVDPATWIIDRLHGFAQDVGSVVPEGFEAYVRVFHPAWQGGPEGRPVTWAQIAASTGRRFHAGAQWPHIAFRGDVKDINQLQDAPPGAPWDTRPEEGSIDLDSAERLITILSPHTSTPEHCWFAFWDGWGVPVVLTPRRRGLFSRLLDRSAHEVPSRGPMQERWDAPKFSIPGRDLLLFSGTLQDAKESFYELMQLPHFQSAYFWWPEDRAWCVATEVDFESTYIGGSRSCIGAIVTDPLLEALEVDIGQGITWDSDTVNPSPLHLRD